MVTYFFKIICIGVSQMRNTHLRGKKIVPWQMQFLSGLSLKKKKSRVTYQHQIMYLCNCSAISYRGLPGAENHTSALSLCVCPVFTLFCIQFLDAVRARHRVRWLPGPTWDGMFVFLLLVLWSSIAAPTNTSSRQPHAKKFFCSK